MIWSFGHGSLSLETPHYVGILNLTPDSFSDGGTATRPEQAVEKGSHLLRHGASALDLGGESTRPDALPVAVDEEWRRVEPALQAVHHALPEAPLSLDSRHADVAAQGLAQGVTILNDVTGFQDPAMLDLARRSEIGVIAMRSRVSEGRFHMPPYDDPAPRTADLALEELRAVKARLLDAGLAPERILLDPGFGFGTTFREDLALWEALPRLEAELDWPASRVCIGLSRKRFLAWRQGAPETPPRERDAFTHQA
ncbi:MAG: dihydropteroate synthase, partial [Firmicutes bacterium]|nr:dihydropteroate synthase [Bacillota bacterium]